MWLYGACAMVGTCDLSAHHPLFTLSACSAPPTLACTQIFGAPTFLYSVPANGHLLMEPSRTTAPHLHRSPVLPWPHPHLLPFLPSLLCTSPDMRSLIYPFTHLLSVSSTGTEASKGQTLPLLFTPIPGPRTVQAYNQISAQD